MRRQGLGLIVNLSSVAGKVSTPFAGWYYATKHAVEALSDALRLEVKTFGIRVILIEPGAIKTGFDGIALGELRRTAKLDAYRGLQPGRDGFPRMRPWPRDRCESVPRAIEAKRPRARYAIGNDSRMLILVRRLLGDGLLDRLTSGWPGGSGRNGAAPSPQATRAGERRVPPVTSRALSGSARGR